MHIEQITRRVSDYEARENIHQQFLYAAALAFAIGFMIGRAV